MINKKDSYTSANTFPNKLLHTKVLTFDGKIKPVHVQLIPTNKCNLNCEFCSCKDREKATEINYKDLESLINSMNDTKAITITGGGEPLMYERINDVIKNMGKNGIEAGLVTNGLLLDKLDHHYNLRWCRISSSDDRHPAFNKINKAINLNSHTDWAFSHVATLNPNYQVIKNLINFANKNDFTHIRIVPDLFNVDRIDMSKISSEVKNTGINDSKVIYQPRNNYTKGTKECYISLLKPVISPEGIFPCCGTQYAIKGSERNMIEEMKMGELKDFRKIMEGQKHFDGSNCDVCYYKDYNDALKKILNKPGHLNFV